MLDLSPPPAGFPGCAACPYLETASPALCLACAAAEREPAGERCAVCGQPLPDGGPCPNTVCTLPDREFSRLFTVSERSEEMWEALRRYKYDEDRSWSHVLGRVLAGHLQERAAELSAYDAVTSCALYIGPDAPRLWDYLRPVLDTAVRRAPVVPVEHDLIVKGRPTGRFLGLGVQERRAIAEGSLREALSVPDPERVAGRRVLVFDDVYSEGYSMREMARALRLAGAVEVAGLVLTRRKGC